MYFTHLYVWEFVPDQLLPAGMEMGFLVLLLIHLENQYFPILTLKVFHFCVLLSGPEKKDVSSFAKTVQDWWKRTDTFI